MVIRWYLWFLDAALKKNNALLRCPVDNCFFSFSEFKNSLWCSNGAGIFWAGQCPRWIDDSRGGSRILQKVHRRIIRGECLYIAHSSRVIYWMNVYTKLHRVSYNTESLEKLYTGGVSCFKQHILLSVFWYNVLSYIICLFSCCNCNCLFFRLMLKTIAHANYNFESKYI